MTGARSQNLRPEGTIPFVTVGLLSEFFMSLVHKLAGDLASGGFLLLLTFALLLSFGLLNARGSLDGCLRLDLLYAGAPGSSAVFFQGGQPPSLDLAPKDGCFHLFFLLLFGIFSVH